MLRVYARTTTEFEAASYLASTELVLGLLSRTSLPAFQDAMILLGIDEQRLLLDLVRQTDEHARIDGSQHRGVRLCELCGRSAI